LGADRISADALDVRIEEKTFRAADGRIRTALRNVVFSAAPGEFIALFGPSGAGKTTTLRIVLGLDTRFTGAVRRPQGRLGVMFQEPRLLPWLSLAENLRLVAPEHGAHPDIPALLAEVGLPDAAGRFPRELSLGMARRASLARALYMDSRLLVLDEPFASLDPRLAASLASVVARRAREARAMVLLATHDLDQILPIADRILVLSGEPATLAADIPVPAGGLEQVRLDLLARFPFLAAVSEPENDS
jgi:NitT/TauT family transport system ATP-binding protein